MPKKGQICQKVGNSDEMRQKMGNVPGNVLKIWGKVEKMCQKWLKVGRGDEKCLDCWKKCICGCACIWGVSHCVHGMSGGYRMGQFE